MDWKRVLRDDGYTTVYEWQDAPNAYYPPHAHPNETAHVVLEGEMTIIVAGKAQVFGPGDRFDVPAGSEHAARIGASGCRYLVGER